MKKNTPMKGPMPFGEFKEILAEVFLVNPARLVPEADFLMDLGADSVRLAELVLRIEKMGIVFTPEAVYELRTVGDAYDYYVRTTSG